MSGPLTPEERLMVTLVPAAAALGSLVERIWPYARGDRRLEHITLPETVWLLAGVVVGAIVVTVLMILMDINRANRMRAMATACMLGISWPQAGEKVLELLKKLLESGAPSVP